MRNIKRNSLVLGAALLGAGVLGVVQPTLAAPDWEERDGRREERRNSSNRSSFSTLEGVVTGDPGRGNTFHLRLDGGGQITVQARGGVGGRLDRGDRVRVYGRGESNGVFYAQNMTVLRDR